MMKDNLVKDLRARFTECFRRSWDDSASETFDAFLFRHWPHIRVVSVGDGMLWASISRCNPPKAEALEELVAVTYEINSIFMFVARKEYKSVLKRLKSEAGQPA